MKQAVAESRPGTRRGVRLLGDIGGTNARFALLENGRIRDGHDLRCADFPDLAAAVESYLGSVGVTKDARPVEAALAVATPLTGDILRMTNNPWQFSVNGIRRELGVMRLIVLNDFTALAMSLVALGATDLEQVGGMAPVDGGPIALLGAGTGLGVSGLVPAAGHYVPLQGEGGHVTLFACNEREQAVIDALRSRFQHVSAERALSGPGIQNLYEVLCALDSREPEPVGAPEITRRALDGSDATCLETLELFCAFLGGIAGNLALTLGATGGVYVGGGIVPRLGRFFAQSAFRERFAAKGRYASYLSPIPAYVIHAKRPAFIGLARAFDEPGPRLETAGEAGAGSL